MKLRKGVLMVILVHTYFRGNQSIVAFLMCGDGLYVSVGNMREFVFHRVPVSA